MIFFAKLYQSTSIYVLLLLSKVQMNRNEPDSKDRVYDQALAFIVEKSEKISDITNDESKTLNFNGSPFRI